MIRFVKMGILLLMILATAACASLPAGTGRSEAGLKKNVETLWDARVHSDWAAVYDLMTDDFKSWMAKDVFIRRANIIFKSYEINKIEMADDTNALVSVNFVVAFQGLEFPSEIRDTWVVQEGQWKLQAPQKNMTPFGPLPAKAHK